MRALRSSKGPSFTIRILGFAIVYAALVFIIFMAVRSHGSAAPPEVTTSASTVTAAQEQNNPGAVLQTFASVSPVQHKPNLTAAKSLPNPAILVLTFNRPGYLERTLASLVRLPLIEGYAVYVSQDGSDQATSGVCKRYQAEHPSLITYWVKPRPVLLNTPNYGYVAQHYKWALERLFIAQGHSHVILVEDDMEFSADFLHYFESTAWLLSNDPTLFCVSSWNDNSRNGLGSSPSLLFRTTHFPGLGWMLRRETYVSLLRSNWPSITHWDNWVRGTVENMDCIIPSMPRNRNFGAVGANMNAQAFAKNIQTVQFYAGSTFVDFGDLSYLLHDNFERHIRTLVKSAQVLNSFAEFREAAESRTFLLLYDNHATFLEYANVFGLWQSPRAHYRFLHVIEKFGDMFLVADRRFCPFVPDTLKESLNKGVLVVAAAQGDSCVQACANRSKTCAIGSMPWLNRCQVLKDHFPCEHGCVIEVGADIPAYVSGSLPTQGFCVLKEHNELFSCEGKNVQTARLCMCE